MNPLNKAKHLATDYRHFLLEKNVFALALGVVIGNQVTKVVNSVVSDMLMPVLGVFLPSNESWRDMAWVISGQNAIKYGSLLGSFIDLVIVSFVVFLMTKLLIHKKASEPTKGCPFCLELLPLAATKCRACTSAVT